jgi:hypothetical protein
MNDTTNYDAIDYDAARADMNYFYNEAGNLFDKYDCTEEETKFICMIYAAFKQAMTNLQNGAV